MYIRSIFLILCLVSSVAQGNEILKIADPRVRAVLIQESKEPLISLAEPSLNPQTSKIKLMPDQQNANAGFYHAPHSECFKVREGLFKALKKMVSVLPDDIGI